MRYQSEWVYHHDYKRGEEGGQVRFPHYPAEIFNILLKKEFSRAFCYERDFFLKTFLYAGEEI